MEMDLYLVVLKFSVAVRQLRRDFEEINALFKISKEYPYNLFWKFHFSPIQKIRAVGIKHN